MLAKQYQIILIFSDKISCYIMGIYMNMEKLRNESRVSKRAMLELFLVLQEKIFV